MTETKSKFVKSKQWNNIKEVVDVNWGDFTSNADKVFGENGTMSDVTMTVTIHSKSKGIAASIEFPVDSLNSFEFHEDYSKINVGTDEEYETSRSAMIIKGSSDTRNKDVKFVRPVASQLTHGSDGTLWINRIDADNSIEQTMRAVKKAISEEKRRGSLSL